MDRAGGFIQQQEMAWNAQWNQHWNTVFEMTGDPIRASAYANAMMRPYRAAPQAGPVGGQGNMVGPQPPGQETPIPVAYEPAPVRFEDFSMRAPSPPPAIGPGLFPQSIRETGAYRSPPPPPAPDAWAQDVRSSPRLADFVARLLRGQRA
jgi:hypothetical protein